MRMRTARLHKNSLLLFIPNYHYSRRRNKIMVEFQAIPENDIDKVINILDPVRHKWNKIGTVLRVEGLEAIRQDYQDSSERLQAMVQTWLTSDDNPTWPKIVEALRTPLVKERRRSERVRDEYCPEYRFQDSQPIREPRSCTRWGAAGLLAVISVCICFAVGGITLIIVGIRGLANAEDYTCDLGPRNVFNSLNLITGVVFLSGLVIIVLFIFYYFFQHINLARRIIYGIIVGAVATSIVLIIADAIYSFYVASQLLPEVDRWDDQKSLCGSAIFISSFAIIITYFLLIGAGVITGAIAISIYILRCTRPWRHLIECLDNNTEGNPS